MSKKYRRYSDEERAAALAALTANANNISKTAREVGVPIRTLENWAKQRRHPEATEMSQRKRKPLADILETIAYKLAKSIPSKISKAPLSQAAISLGITIEKMRLLRDQSTGNVDLQVTVEDLTAARQRLEGWESARSNGALLSAD